MFGHACGFCSSPGSILNLVGHCVLQHLNSLSKIWEFSYCVLENLNLLSGICEFSFGCSVVICNLGI